MSHILCVGIATVDIINEVMNYPAEDEEIRILSQQKRRGGNASNTAVILSQLGHQCSWAGTLLNIQADDSDSQTILNDLDRYHIDYHHCHFLSHGKVPTSYITLSQQNGSRTITHYRDLPEYTLQEFNKIELNNFNWIHFEGRNITQTQQMMLYSKKNDPKQIISIEIEKSRQGIEQLIPLADIILFSKNYVLEQGFNSAKAFFKNNQQLPRHKIFFCAWGDAGAAAYAGQQYYWQDALDVDAIDTIAAGDVFNAAIIDQQLKKQNIIDSLFNACQLSGMSCTKKGLELHLA